ncbi:23107_t:CDS:1, partial [Racocetra persica]
NSQLSLTNIEIEFTKQLSKDIKTRKEDTFRLKDMWLYDNEFKK